MMFRLICVLCVLATTPAWAQTPTPTPTQPPPPPRAEGQQPPQEPRRVTPQTPRPTTMTVPAQPPTAARPTTLTQPAERPPDARPPDARRPRGRDVNLQIELTITDQLGSATPDKKVVSMLAADGTFGRIRSMAGVVNAIINVDARPQILANDQILLELTIEYGPPNREGAPARERPATLNESLTVILQNGKSQLISQASDPAADRKMSVEVRANVLK